MFKVEQKLRQLLCIGGSIQLTLVGLDSKGRVDKNVEVFIIISQEAEIMVRPED